jgi:hypothetical protein
MPMSRLEDLVAGARVAGIDPSGAIQVIAVEWHGSQAVTLSYRDPRQSLQERMLFRSDEGTFAVADSATRPWTFDGDGHVFRLVAEARRIQLAHLCDPYLALTSSEVEPLPHQIEAVYGEMLPRHPLRFLLADDPGAGKTIMAGLYIKELMIRGDLERCLIVAPGSLVGQWRDELREKFDLRFEIISKELLDDAGSTGFLEGRDRVIARVDQLARRQDVVERLPARAKYQGGRDGVDRKFRGAATRAHSRARRCGVWLSSRVDRPTAHPPVRDVRLCRSQAAWQGQPGAPDRRSDGA